MRNGAWLFFYVASISAWGNCLPVSGDRILGRDLALLDARFGMLPATLAVAPAPLPGSPRILTKAELLRLARAHGIALSDPLEACFEVPLAPLDASEALNEMHRALPAAEIEVLELSHQPVPRGRIEFPASGLEPPSRLDSASQLWHGFVRYSGTRRTPVWARVGVSQTALTVVPDRDLPVGAPVAASSLRVEIRKGMPHLEQMAARVEEVAGLIPRRALKPGVAIALSSLVKPPDIRRGDSVAVAVVCGAARLRLHAVAERDARTGEYVELRNPSNGRIFRARVDGPGAVMMLAAGSGR